ncbi:MAG TPA: cytochrome d ubiquinol oxidase subunit II [Planctomycetota bacterium]|nr:cytochrome d ubiquinol oxidase subunit II [Planctomycetota bacterium]
MPELPQLVVAVVLVAMIAYVVSGGADFGGGVWELFARGPRAEQQVRALREAIAPIWEANHVWLILVVVLQFVCFPMAFSAIMVALHVPVTLMLVGIVLRGAAFAFQSYSAGDHAIENHSVRLFRLASAITPMALGVVAGAIAAGEIRVDAATGVVTSGALRPWLLPFLLLVGAMTLALCTYLAAVYMTLETDGQLREDFRRRALAAGCAVGAIALPAAWVAFHEAPVIGVPLLASPWSLPFHVVTGVVAVLALVALWRRRFRTARLLAIAQTALILIGWGVAQYPKVLAPDLDIGNCAAAPAVLEATLFVLGVGTVLLVPAFVCLYRVFKRT